MVTIPHDLEAEAAVLGACMVNRAWRDQTLATITAEDFYAPEHSQVFQAVMDLHASGEPADHSAVTFRTSLPKEKLVRLQASAPLSLAAPLSVVADRAARRRLIGLGSAVVERAADLTADVGITVGALQRETETVRLPVDQFTPARDASDLIAEPDDEYDWIVPRLLEAGDRIIWTAGEGVGKSEMQLQLAVMLAAGIHPFARYDIRRLRVLIVDLENSERQLRRRVRRLVEKAGDRYRGGLKITEPRMAGIDLRDLRDFRWLDRHCEQVRPELLVIGPLYKAFRVRGGEKKTDETAAEEAAFALDKLRQRYGCAVSIEAHSPHGDHGDRDGLRPYGASLWMRWPEFGFGLKPVPGEKEVDVKQWRGMRDRDRDWPTKLYVGNHWSWEAA